MPEIYQLPPSVINKIAAGEVIERPASIVKELMENAVDAGAGRVDVTLERGGCDLVRVFDTGCGMTPEQLPLAVASHATSKIRTADDLFHVETLGFRGEALASIAEVSRIRIRTRTQDSAAGAELEVVGGNASEIVPCGCPVGTSIEIRELFFNTPVRRKFLKTPQTELGHATEAFTRIALAHPRVHFTLRHKDRLIHDLPPVDSWRERITSFFGRELGERLIWVEHESDDIRLDGYAADPTYNRSNNRMQYLFLNGRHIRDRALQHALSEAYRGLLLTGRYPIAFLRLEMCPSTIDVNVHPTKLEVRFEDGGRVYSRLLATLRNKFLATDLTARVGSAPEENVLPTDQDPAAAINTQHAARQQRELEQWARTGGHSATPESTAVGVDFTTRRFGDDPSARGPTSEPPAPGSDSAFPSPSSPDPSSPTSIPPTLPPGPEASSETAPTPAPHHEGSARFDGPQHLPAGRRPANAGIQLHNRYLVTETEEGMIVIDQHALHERILYEQIREKVLNGKLESQRLLVPEPVTLAPAEAAAVLDARETLAKLGILVEQFGGDSILVSAYPAMMSNLNPAELLRQVVDQLMSGPRQLDRRDIVDELLHMMSCKAAVKAGDRLSAEEVDILLDHRHICQDAHHCPHGRPTSLVFTRDELDRRFKRT